MTTEREKISRTRRPRWRKLIQPRLQFQLIGSFAGVASVALLAQFLIVNSRLAQFAAKMPEGGDYLMSELSGLTISMLILSFGVLLPTTVAIGILITFRIAGPVHHFKEHMDAIARGEDPGVCRLRPNDSLQDLCSSINAAAERLHAHQSYVLRASEDQDSESRREAA